MEKDLTCVVCSHICLPPEKIFQCDEGDLLCQGCMENPKLILCPECNKPLSTSGLARNKALERLAKKHFEAIGLR